MTTAYKLSEESIQKALSEGYITKMEADQMLRVYFNKSDISSRPHSVVQPAPSRQQST